MIEELFSNGLLMVDILVIISALVIQVYIHTTKRRKHNQQVSQS